MKKRSLLAAVSLLMAVCGVSLATSQPAFANGTCPDNNMCFFPCYLAESCSKNVYGIFTTAGCNDVSPFTIHSVKNESGRKYVAYTTSKCTGSNAPLYPETDGNMSGVYVNFNSFQRTVI